MANPLDFLRVWKKKTDASAEEQKSAEPASVDVVEEPPEPASAEPEAADASAADPVAEPPEADPTAPEFVDVQPPDADETRGAATPRGLYVEALRVVGRFFSAAAKMETDEADALPIVEVEDVGRALVAAMVEGDELVGFAVGPYGDEKRFIVPHCVNVAILSQRVAREQGLEDAELETLATAALIHDVGSVRIPKEIFYKPDSLSAEEWEVMRERPMHSRDIILTLGAGYRAAAEIACQVHERLDGNGYPRGLHIDDIALEGSILGAVDIFEAFIHPRPYKKTVPAAAMYGVDNLMRLSHQFGDGVLKALVRSVGLFPVGTHVKLNSGEVAKVLEGRKANPMRPKVKVLFDPQDRRLGTPKTIDLMQTPHLYVFRPLSSEDLRALGISL